MTFTDLVLKLKLKHEKCLNLVMQKFAVQFECLNKLIWNIMTGGVLVSPHIMLQEMLY